MKQSKRFYVSGDFAGIEVLLVQEGKDFIFSFDSMGFEVCLYGDAVRLEDGRYKILGNYNECLEDAKAGASFIIQGFLEDNQL